VKANQISDPCGEEEIRKDPKSRMDGFAARLPVIHNPSVDLLLGGL
jgi:hypothetical protein